MAEQLNPVATHQLPAFITPPGQTDVLMVVMAFILGLAVLGFGILYLRLHSLPEQVAHKGQKVQFEIVAILGLISLFTHMQIFWVIGLLLAFVDLPDFGGFLGRIAGSVERMAGLKPGAGAADVAQTGSAAQSSTVEVVPDSRGHGEPSAATPLRTVAGRKEIDHA